MLIPYDVIIYILDILIEEIGISKGLSFFQLNKEINKRLKEKYQLIISQEQRLSKLLAHVSKLIEQREKLCFPACYSSEWPQLNNEMNILNHHFSLHLRKEYDLNKELKAEIYFANAYNQSNYSPRLFLRRLNNNSRNSNSNGKKNLLSDLKLLLERQIIHRISLILTGCNNMKADEFLEKLRSFKISHPKLCVIDSKFTSETL